MADAIAITKTSMLADLERLTTFGQNFANSTTAGYKRQVPVSLGFTQLMDPESNRTYGSSGLSASATDFSVGSVQNTARPLDLAVEGDGFLVVNTPAGVRYTRRGDLHLDGQGRLVIGTGDPVAGSGGDIHLTTEQVVISSTGAITVGGQLVGQLEVTRFDNPSQLVYEGNGLFSGDAASVTDNAAPPQVKQGFLEASNVQAAQDMLGLMETSRHFDLVHNVVTAYDQMLDSAINTLGSA